MLLAYKKANQRLTPHMHGDTEVARASSDNSDDDLLPAPSHDVLQACDYLDTVLLQAPSSQYTLTTDQQLDTAWPNPKLRTPVTRPSLATVLDARKEWDQDGLGDGPFRKPSHTNQEILPEEYSTTHIHPESRLLWPIADRLSNELENLFNTSIVPANVDRPDPLSKYAAVAASRKGAFATRRVETGVSKPYLFLLRSNDSKLMGRLIQQTYLLLCLPPLGEFALLIGDRIFYSKSWSFSSHHSGRPDTGYAGAKVLFYHATLASSVQPIGSGHL